MVFVTVSVVVVLKLLEPVDRDGEMRARDAALYAFLPLDAHAGDAEGVDLIQKLFRLGLGQKLQKRRGEHIARRAHAAVQIQNPHFPSLPFMPVWFIMLAR